MILNSLILQTVALKISMDEYDPNILHRPGQDQIPGRGQRTSLEPLGWRQSLPEYRKSQNKVTFWVFGLFYRHLVTLCHSDKRTTLSGPRGLGKSFHRDFVPLILQVFMDFYIPPSCQEF